MLWNSLETADTVMGVCANRAGKTAIAIEILADFATRLGTKDNRGILISTNHTVIEDNIINEFKLRWPALIKGYNQQKHYLKLVTGHTIWCVSPENPDAIEGKSRVAYVIIDEWVTVPKYLYNAARIRGTDLGAPFLIIGTPIVRDQSSLPVGLEWGKKLFEMGCDPKYCGDDVPKRERIVSHKWGMADNPYISPDEIALIANNPFMSEREKSCRLYGDFMELSDTIFDPNLLTPEVCGYKLSELNSLHLETYGIVDPATGQKASAREDDTAILIASIGPNYTIYGREMLADKYNADEAEKIIIDRHNRYEVRKWGVESVAFQNLYVDKLRRSQLHDGSIRFVGLKRYGGRDGKPMRHSRLVPFLENGRLKFPVNESGTQFIRGFDKLVEQMKAVMYIRNDNIHDDCVDALADIVNPDMGIMKGMRKSVPPTTGKKIKNPLMSVEAIRKIRNPEEGDWNDYTGELLSIASI